MNFQGIWICKRGLVMKRLHLLISGRVQGVCYRAYAQQAAHDIGGIGGWVRNLADGRVEAVAEGEDAALQRFVSWCYKGPPAGRVTHIEQQEQIATGEYGGFRIRY